MPKTLHFYVTNKFMFRRLKEKCGKQKKNYYIFLSIFSGHVYDDDEAPNDDDIVRHDESVPRPLSIIIGNSLCKFMLSRYKIPHPIGADLAVLQVCCPFPRKLSELGTHDDDVSHIFGRDEWLTS